MDKLNELCLDCLKCCKNLYIETQYDYNDLLVEFFQARGCECINDKNNKLLIKINIECPHLKQTGCDIYESRPIICREFDGLRDGRNLECKWSLINKDEYNKIIEERKKETNVLLTSRGYFRNE